MKVTPNLRLALLFFALFFSVTPAQSQTLITIGNSTVSNTNTQYPAPYGNFYFGARHQFIILASELTGAGMIAGDITSLAFNVDVPQGTQLDGFTISLKNTTSPNVGATFETGVTTVYGPSNYTETAGWNTHTFSGPFFWDGVSNLLIETCFNNTAWSNNARTFWSTTSFNSAGYYRADMAGVCTQTPTTVSNRRPDMRFDWNPGNVPPDADFIASTTSTCDGIVDFTDLSSFNPTSWQWDFGDGNTSTAQNPQHTYLVSGTYDVQLIACNANGCDTLLMTNYINVNLGGGLPVPASCTPTTLTYCCGFGITDVSFNTINNSSMDGSVGYEDFTCQQTTVTEGVTYTLTIQTPTPTTHNAAAWIDFNNDGMLNDITERVLTSNSANTHTTNITIPGTAVLNTPLRMRVSADYDLSAPPGPCTDSDFGQIEDYTIIIVPNTSPPDPDFIVSDTISCDGTISFTDLTTNLPTGWFWEFGDGNFSNQQNPTYTYTASGTYNVTLTASNAFGSNQITYVAIVTINLGGQLTPAACTPTTLAYCCGYGIFNVTFNNIDFDSPDGSEGYQDNSCTENTTVTEGMVYPISIRTGQSANQDTRVWIDYNNDGVLDDVTEVAFTSLNTIDPSGSITIPGGAVLNTPLRMRVMSDFVGAGLTSCTNQQWGQTEDYGITILQNLNPPVAQFTADSLQTCAGTVNFMDQSSNGPTSWSWDFGDGVSSTMQNPTHTYLTPGTYTVWLVVSNANGTDSTSLLVTYDPGACIQNNMPPFGTQTSNYCYGTLYDDGGPFFNYSDFTNGTFVIAPTNAVQVTLNFTMFDFVASFGGDTLYVYDGPNIGSPLIGAYSGNAMPNGGTIVSTGGSITLRQVTDNNVTDPGFALDWSCVQGTPQLPVPDFTASQTTVCENQCVTFTDQSTSTSGGVTDWSWSFPGGTPSTSTAQNPTVCYATSGSYDVTLSVTDATGTSDTTFTNYITVTTTGCDTILIADFSISETDICEGECVDFTDNSFSNASGGVTTWFWTFTGGNPSTSNAQNPGNICYDTPGAYSVTLIVTDANGQHDTTMVNLINVSSLSNCDTTTMPPSGTTFINSCVGYIADDGGAFADYSDNTDGIITIDPPGTDNVRLDFTEFNFEQGFDFLYIYDGPDAGSPLIGQYTGTALPNGGIVISTGEALTLRQVTDFGFTESGFLCSISCVTGIDDPAAGMNLNVYPNPARDEFTIDLTMETPKDQMTLSISNALGQMILLEDIGQTGSFQKRMDATMLRPGVYFITINHIDGQVVRRLIIE